MKNQLLFVLLLIHAVIFSQDKLPFIDIDQTVIEVAEASDEKNYEKAIELLDKINKNDSTYASVLVSKSYYQMILKQYDSMLATIDEGLKLDCGDVKASFYQNKGASLLNQEKYEEAIAALDEGLTIFPKNYMLTYNKGLSLEKLGRIEDAIEEYKNTIILNPFYKKPYLQLGNICYRQERISQALMCYNMYLLLEPDAANSFNIINSVNNIVSSKNENKRNNDIQISEDDEAFEEIDLIITNRIALNKKYKIDNEINVALVKQNHIMLEQLKDFNGKGGFWDIKFVPFFKWIQREGYFNDFTYTTMYSIENKSYKKIVEKNIKKIKAFINIYKPKWVELVAKNRINWDGKEEEITFYFDNYVQGVGKFENNKTIGFWQFYNENGRLTGQGNFNSNGERDGAWKWFHDNGVVKETANYKAGKLEGENATYYSNSRINNLSVFKNDLLEGEYKKYNENGALLEKKYFKNGKLNGLYESYFKVGKALLEYSIPYTNDLINDKAFEYHDNGEIFNEMNFENGKRNGLEKKFHANGKKYTEINYVDGEYNGDYKTYYGNGNPNEIGQAVEGYYDGPWKTFYKNGAIQSDFSYAKGKLDGKYVYYDKDKKPHYEYIYRKGEIIAYKFYDKKGAVLKEAKKKGGEFMYVGYAPNGNKTAEGLYDISGGKKGAWKFFTSNGILRDEGTYVDNNAQGAYKVYYNNGKKKSVTNYKNDSIIGYYVDYHKNGQINSQGWYKENESHGEWRQYSIDGTVNIVNFYHKGRLHGVQKYYSGSGQLYRAAKYKFGDLISDTYYNVDNTIFEKIVYNKDTGAYTIKTHHKNNEVETSVDYLNGVKHGNYTYYDFYGNKRTTATYVNGKLQGKLTWYYKNGSVESVIDYISGDRHGDYIKYHENGQIEVKSTYDFGSIEGTWTTYYSDGTLDSVSEYENNEYHGRREFYSPSGKLQLVRFYEYGRLVGYSYLDKESKELPIIPLQNETGKIIAYYDNGNVSRELEFKNGDVINTYNTFYYNGQLENKMTYDQDELNGADIEYYPDGKVKKHEEYLLGYRHGVAKEYFANGNLKKETNYLNGTKEGVAKTHNEEGELVRTETYFNNDIIAAETH